MYLLIFATEPKGKKDKVIPICFKRIYDVSLARNSCVNPVRSDSSVSGTYGHPCCKELFLRQLLQSNYPFDGIATPEEMCFHVYELPSPVTHSPGLASHPLQWIICIWHTSGLSHGDSEVVIWQEPAYRRRKKKCAGKLAVRPTLRWWRA